MKGVLLLAKKESEFKSKLYKEIRDRFPGSEVLPNDANYLQGVPDATVYFPNGRYVLLEGKRASTSHKQPNQEYYVGRMNEMSFSRFICPENKEEVLHDLQQAFRS